MTHPKRILCTMACLESLRNHQGYLYRTIGSIYKLYESMPEGEQRNRLLDEISKLDVIAGGIKEALDVLEDLAKGVETQFVHAASDGMNQQGSPIVRAGPLPKGETWR